MRFKNILTGIVRRLNSFSRPSKQTNLRKLHALGEDPEIFTLRDATIEDIQQLGKLHAITWSQTYKTRNPNIELRQVQWQKAFIEDNDGSWFCIVIENNNKELVGFAKGITTKNEKSGELLGDLNKIYLLNSYQRVGLGTKLFLKVINRFLEMGINKMTVFGVPQNPSCYFHEAMGGKRIYAENGDFNGGYQWNDLPGLSKTYFTNS